MGVGFGVRSDFLENILHGGGGLPVPSLAGQRVIQDDPREIEGAGAAVGDDFVMSKAVMAPGCQLLEGSGGGDPSGHIHGSGNAGVRGGDQLSPKQGQEIAGMKTIPDLVAMPAEAKVTQGAAAQMGVDPVSEDALIRPAELPCPGHDPAAVDPHREIKSGPVFQGERFAGKLAGPVEGHRGGGGKAFRNS